MQAIIEGDLRGTREVKTEKGKMFIHIVEMKDRVGVPYHVNVLSMKDNKKPGINKFNVNISLQREKKTNVIVGLKIWEIQ